MRAKIAILIAISIFSNPTIASASFNGKEDFSEPRVVAISMSSSINGTPWANGSGYIYSPRIVFAAGHTKDNNEFSQFYVSQPNKQLEAGTPVVKVVKMMFPDTYDINTHKDDFAIFILEKPIANFEKAPLISEKLLSQVIAEKRPMKSLGFGVYQDVCVEMGVVPPCQFGSERTSLVPRSIEVTPWTASEINDKFGRYSPEVADHLFLTSPYKGGPCAGDSGGPVTVSIDNINYYVATVTGAHFNSYGCGMSGGSKVGETIGYTSPVYKFLEFIAAAEKYVTEHPYVASPIVSPTTSPTASTSILPKNSYVAPQYKYILKLAQGWAKTSRTSDTALKQCSTARDKGVIYKNGKATPIGTTSTNLRRDLKKSPGFNACLAGFSK